MCEQEFRCDYLTPAFWKGATSSNPAEDYREILTGVMNPEDRTELTKSALTSGFTLAVFNGAIAFGSLDAQDAEILFTDLRKAFDQCSQIDSWEEQGGADKEADFPFTLNLIQIEILGSIGRSGLATPEAMSLLLSALKRPDDSLHFPTLESLRIIGGRNSRATIHLYEYLTRLDQLGLPEESIPHLKGVAKSILPVD